MVHVVNSAFAVHLLLPPGWQGRRARPSGCPVFVVRVVRPETKKNVTEAKLHIPNKHTRQKRALKIE